MEEQPEQIVNYVWINKKPFKGSDGDKLCGAPLHYIDKALHNSKRYPDAQFNIWIDWRYLDDMSKFWLESHVYFQNCPNVKIQSLMDIEKYAENFDDAPDNKHCLWSRIDYARLVVLESVLKDNLWCQVFYSDFDANDIEVTKTNLQKKLQLHGIVIATNECNAYENSFFGVSKKGISALDKLVKYTQERFTMDLDGFDALLHFLYDENYATSPTTKPAIAIKTMPRSGTKTIKPKDIHHSLGLC